MANHKNAPFSQIHVAKIRTGTLASLPASQGIGDTYFTTDTNQLFFGIGVGVGQWFEFVGGGGGGQAYSGAKRQMNATFTVTGGDEGQVIDWTQPVWAYGITGSSDVFVYPNDGFFSYNITLLIENTAAGRWHLEMSYDNVSVSDAYEWQCSGDGTPFAISFSGQFKAIKNSGSGDNQAYAYVYQNSGSNQDILTWSNMVVQYLGPVPA